MATVTDRFEHLERPDQIQFRLMRLHQGAHSDPITCSFRVYPLPPHPDVPPYEAISYVCGTEPSTCPVDSWAGTAYTGPSLYSALQ